MYKMYILHCEKLDSILHFFEEKSTVIIVQKSFHFLTIIIFKLITFTMN